MADQLDRGVRTDPFLWRLQMIEFRNVTFGYEKNRPVVRDLSFTISDGENVGLIGANGAGKSTVMKLILGIIEGKGDILINGIRTEKKNLSAIRKLCGFILQNSDDQMFMPTVFDDLMFGPLNSGVTGKEAEAAVDEVLDMLGITDLKNRYNHKLSGGEKRMAAIASVLVMDPQVLLMDEPASALDPYNRRLVINTIRKLPQTKMITSHDLDMILDTCSRVILIGNGTIQADGPADVILHDEALLKKNRLELPLRFQK